MSGMLTVRDVLCYRFLFPGKTSFVYLLKNTLNLTYSSNYHLSPHLFVWFFHIYFIYVFVVCLESFVERKGL